MILLNDAMSLTFLELSYCYSWSACVKKGIIGLDVSAMSDFWTKFALMR
jgi:hypothetical protein